MNLGIDLDEFGKYRIGLTTEEIKTYLKSRSRSGRLGILYKKFCKISGINTMAIEDGKVLMYRSDVLRFANQLFCGIPTYWDWNE